MPQLQFSKSWSNREDEKSEVTENIRKGSKKIPNYLSPQCSCKSCFVKAMVATIWKILIFLWRVQYLSCSMVIIWKFDMWCKRLPTWLLWLYNNTLVFLDALSSLKASRYVVDAYCPILLQIASTIGVGDTQSDSIQCLNFAKKWFIQYLIQYCFTQDSIQNIIQFKKNLLIQIKR